MSEYVIVTDSGSDISVELINELGIGVIPLHYNLDGTEYMNYPDHSEYPVSKFYADIKAGKPISTSALNMSDVEEGLVPYLKDGKDVIYIVFSSGLSSTYQNARNTAETLREDYPERKIEVIDSLSASFGQGLLVYLCAKKKEAGAAFEEVVEYANAMRHNIVHEFTVDDLGQLKRGGRISPATAFFGSVLQIKPMLYVSPEGKLVSYAKMRGRQATLKMLADKIVEQCCDKAETPIFVSHGDCEDEALMVADMIKAQLPDKKFFMNHIGPVIGGHAGYKTIAVFCVTDKGRGVRG